jgi:phage replication O-like protein O
MAKPQIENGFTRVANEILEAIAKIKLNGTQFRILMIVWRYTYGFSRKEHELSINFLCDATGIIKRQIQKELKVLMEMGVLIEARAATFTDSRIIGFNKNYEAWATKKSFHHHENEEVPNEGGGAKLDTCHQIDTEAPNLTPGGGAKLDTGGGAKLDTQERKVLKKDFKEINNNNNAFDFYEQNFGLIPPFIIAQIGDWLEDFDEQHEILIFAMGIALERNQRKWSYAQAILKDWHSKGAKSLKDCEAIQQEFTNKQVKGKYNKKPIRQEMLPNWFDSDGSKQLDDTDIDERKKIMEEKLKTFRGVD